MTLEGMSKDALIMRLRDWHEAGDVCEMLSITVEDLLCAFPDKLDDAYEREKQREAEDEAAENIVQQGDLG